MKVIIKDQKGEIYNKVSSFFSDFILFDPWKFSSVKIEQSSSKNENSQSGFTLIEILIIAIIIVIVGSAISVLFLKIGKSHEDTALLTTANAAAENGLEALSNLPREQLTSGGSFSIEDDNQIQIRSVCSTSNCDWLVIPSQGTDSPAKGTIYQETAPEGKTVLLRRWLIEDIDAGLGLKKITMVITVDEQSTQPVAILSTTVGKS